VVPYEQIGPISPVQRMFEGGFTPRPSTIAYASSGLGSVGGSGQINAGTSAGPALREPSALLLSAGRPRGNLIAPGPSYDVIPLGPGRPGLERIASPTVRGWMDAYVGAVLSSRQWSWEEIGLGHLDSHEQGMLRFRAVDMGMLPRIAVDPVTRNADFSSVVIEERMLPEELWQASDDMQFRYLDQLIGGREPDLTWHHHELPGVMQLVPFSVHNIVGHDGGRSPGQWAFGPR
jgi:hypothetical protein